MRARSLIVVACAAALALALWLSGKTADARDLTGQYAGSPHEPWYKSQRNSRGEWCCNESDAHPYYGDYQINGDGSVTLEGETIPKEQVLSSINPTGHAVWWFLDVAGAKRTYCFAPGTLS